MYSVAPRRQLTSALKLAARLSLLPQLTQILGHLAAPVDQSPAEVTLVLAQVDTELLAVALLADMERLDQRVVPDLMVVSVHLDQPEVDKADSVEDRNSNPAISRNLTRTKAEAVNNSEARVDKAKADMVATAVKDQDRNRALKADPLQVQVLQPTK